MRLLPLAVTAAGKAAVTEANPPPGYVAVGTVVMLTSPTPGAQIYSTTSTGVPPELNAAGNPFINEDTTLIAFARAEGYEDSDEVSFEYQVDGVTIEELESYLRERGANTEDTPHTVRLASGTAATGGAMGTINDAIRNAGVFINLDLSDCRASGNTITGFGFNNASGTLPSGSDFNIIWDNQYIKSIILPGSLRTIGENAFCYCEANLESVTIPDGVTGIGNGAFAYCRVLKSVVIPDRVESIGDNAFFCDYALESVTIGSGVRSIHDWAFDACGALTSVTFRGSGAVIAFEGDTFPEGAGLLSAGGATGAAETADGETAGGTPMVAGTYTLNGGVWTKE